MTKKNNAKNKNSKSNKNSVISQRTHKSFEVKKNQYYTIEQLADLWNLESTATVLRAIRNKGLPASRIGRKFSILGSNAMKFHEKMRVYK